MCCDCNYGPFGHQLEGEPRLWLACDLLHQQDASLGSNEADFPLPEGLDMRALQSSYSSEGRAWTQVGLDPGSTPGGCILGAVPLGP